jgi:hypothetical protein
MKASVPSKLRPLQVETEVENRLIRIQPGVTSVRSLRIALIELAYALTARPQLLAILLLTGVAITRKRLEQEWEMALSVFRPDLLDRLSICISDGDRISGIPRNPDPETERALVELLRSRGAGATEPVSRTDARFVITKVLLHQWLTSGEAVTVDWLGKTSGYSYPTVATVLQRLGSLIERDSSRRVGLRSFPADEFARMVAVSDGARSTVRFADSSGNARSAEAHLRRLEKMNPPNVALGGVIGAKHYDPDVDLVGTPRLDLSIHCSHQNLDVALIQKLDPALKPVTDPRSPANVVVHAVHHLDPFFKARQAGLQWADPVECLLDLHEGRLQPQANEFLEALERNRPNTYDKRD